jgi:hypothetical protein
MKYLRYSQSSGFSSCDDESDDPVGEDPLKSFLKRHGLEDGRPWDYDGALDFDDTHPVTHYGLPARSEKTVTVVLSTGGDEEWIVTESRAALMALRVLLAPLVAARNIEVLKDQLENVFDSEAELMRRLGNVEVLIAGVLNRLEEG